jgi:hypothetical protein
MIGTIRKHSARLWWVIATLTIISFVWWGTNPASRNGGRGAAGLGTIYGKPVTPDAFDQAKREYFIDYWLRNQQFPDRNPNISRTEMDRDIYERLILTEKAKQLGIHVSPESQVAGANMLLASLGGRDKGPVPMSALLQQVLQPEGLTAADFQRFIEHDLAIQQLIEVYGLSGALVSPQEAAQMYDRDHQEVSAQAVFFTGTNYMSQIPVTPAAVSTFYTNFMAYYRLPARVQLNYVAFDLSNFVAAAEQKFGKTNIAAQAEAEFAQHGMQAVPGASTPEEAKAKIREFILHQYAAQLAVEPARQFVKELFAMEPVSGANLVTLAKNKGLTVKMTAPFSEEQGPEEISASAEVITKEAFKLTADSPFPERPIVGANAVYVIGLAQQLPSEIPAFDQIRDRVTKDYQYHEAALKARAEGTNFFVNATVQMAAGKTFAQAALAAHLIPVALKPFSPSSPDVPEAAGLADPRAIKQAEFTTQPGHISQFVPTAEGGFLLFVQSLLPVNEKEKTSEMPQYLAQVRRQRQNEAFNLWLQSEANRELRNTPIYNELVGGSQSPRSP